MTVGVWPGISNPV